MKRFPFSATVAVVGAVIGEWLGGQKGLGVYGRRAASSLKAPELFASVIILAATGALLFVVVASLERRLTPWNKTAFRKGRLSDYVLCPAGLRRSQLLRNRAHYVGTAGQGRR